MANIENQKFVEQMQEKVREDLDLTSEERARLIELAQVHCNIEATLLLIRVAFYYKRRPAFEAWTSYYEKARQQEQTCWNEKDVLRLLTLAVELYGYDEEDQLAFEVATELYRRAPNDWDIAHLYLSEAWRFLPENELVPVLEHLITLAPPTGRAYFTLGTHLQQFWIMFEKEKYRLESIRFYQKALVLGLDARKADLARKTIERLENTEE